MSLRVLIVDDELHGVNAAAKMVRMIPDLKLVAKLTSPMEALNLISSGKLHVDIILLDIGMEELPGDEFARIIGARAVVIFITGFTDYALKAFRLDAVDYLVKPLNAGDFMDAINKARQKLRALNRIAIFGHEQKSIFIKVSPTSIVEFALNDLKYIESDDKVVYLHLVSKEKPVMIMRKLGYMEDTLPKDIFLRIHQSYIVNMTFVKAISGNKLLFKDGKDNLEIGSTYMQIVYSMF
ncbi:LytTR family DNA-binding domain-containing protein [Mucilaginibacter sp. SMC90]|uniref:LytR/AlgR family response regulator transcription factor n=1 Tax=Mucilaginibacter sp. SMC90 TaxID=2929803 RepID=UPI001FB2D2E7|nr:LytTR family DNA-binding domain-containing protein [Mucilaginibacter sp. SMC90]UOE51340.1 LytTR family DNA-binding domain-containing protein [Mucilaginibacter sp. SMC90]